MSDEEGEDDATVVVNKKKRRLPKPVRNILISAGILFILLIGAGVLYTYYMDQSGGKILQAHAPTAQQNPTQVKPVQPAANSPEGASIEVLSSPVSQGSNADITVQTLQGSKCSISVAYGKVPAVDSGLVTKESDIYGSVSWSWTVSPTAPLGTWPVNVTCLRNGKTGFVQGNLQVTK
jgi:hypothetical protein